MSRQMPRGTFGRDGIQEALPFHRLEHPASGVEIEGVIDRVASDDSCGPTSDLDDVRVRHGKSFCCVT